MKHDDAARARIARGWASSCVTQEEYAAKFGISSRALRAWMGRYCAGRRPEARARAIIENAIEDLRALLAGLDADAERIVGSGGHSVTADMPRRQAGAASPPADGPPVHSPTPMPRSGFFSGF